MKTYFRSKTEAIEYLTKSGYVFKVNHYEHPYGDKAFLVKHDTLPNRETPYSVKYLD